MLRSWSYRLLALAAGSASAALALATELVAIYLIGALLWADYTNPMVIILSGLVAAVFAAPAFLVGLIMIGGPSWWILHRINRTSVLAAVAASTMGSVTFGAITLGLLGLPLAAVASAALLAIPGGIAGWVVSIVAYDRPKPPPAPPS